MNIRLLIKKSVINALSLLMIFRQQARQQNIQLLSVRQKRLLINCAMGIGDFIMFTPALKAIKDAYKDSEVTALITSSLSDMVGLIPNFDRVFVIKNSNKILGRIRELSKLFQICFRRADIFINASDDPNTTSFLITFFCRARVKIGFNVHNSKRLYTHYIQRNKMEHNIVQYLKIPKLLGIKVIETSPKVTVPPEAREKAEQFLREHGVSSHDLIVCLHPQTKGMKGYKSKNWDKRKFAQVGLTLSARYNAKIIILGGRDDVAVAETIKEMIGDNAVIQAGKTSLKVAAGILEKADLLITNDSSIMHLGAALNIPMVSLWGPTSPFRWGYMGDNKIAIWKDLPCANCREKPDRPLCNRECLSSITVSEVLESSETLLKRVWYDVK